MKAISVIIRAVVLIILAVSVVGLTLAIPLVIAMVLVAVMVEVFAPPIVKLGFDLALSVVTFGASLIGGGLQLFAHGFPVWLVMLTAWLETMPYIVFAISVFTLFLQYYMQQYDVGPGEAIAMMVADVSAFVSTVVSAVVSGAASVVNSGLSALFKGLTSGPLGLIMLGVGAWYLFSDDGEDSQPIYIEGASSVT